MSNISNYNSGTRSQQRVKTDMKSDVMPKGKVEVKAQGTESVSRQVTK